jgi:hypothetical protein
MNANHNLYDVLKWITGILDHLDIEYQVTGGLAAKCYGSSRPLHDIDLYVPEKAISKLQRKLENYIEFGPEHYRDELWDIIFMKLNYQGQQIEFADADSTRYFDSHSQQWVKEDVDFSKSVIMEYEGIMLPIMPKEKLIEYKQRLNRTVDQLDLEEIKTK